jgi:hypothetical protein
MECRSIQLSQCTTAWPDSLGSIAQELATGRGALPMR